jgi:hypothetical protein
MFRENKTEKYIKGYLKKHYPKQRSIQAGSAANYILGRISAEMKDFWEIYKDFANWDFNPFPKVTLHERVNWPKDMSRAQLYGGLSSLERGKYVKVKKKSQTVCLTEKGIKEILKYKMRSNLQESRWDGKWRIVIFDIAEATRKDRNYLRSQLKWIGFEELQKSIWVFPYEIRSELKEFIKLCKLEFNGDIRFILADTIEPERELRKKFNL